MGDEAAGARGREARGGSVAASPPAASPPITPGIPFEWDRDIAQAALDVFAFFKSTSVRYDENRNFADLVDQGEADLLLKVATYDDAVQL